eukprot:scaffold5237_cov170-Ochromonas_danica.AAC.22
MVDDRTKLCKNISLLYLTSCAFSFFYVHSPHCLMFKIKLNCGEFRLLVPLSVLVLRSFIPRDSEKPEMESAKAKNLWTGERVPLSHTASHYKGRERRRSVRFNVEAMEWFLEDVEKSMKIAASSVFAENSNYYINNVYPTGEVTYCHG